MAQSSSTDMPNMMWQDEESYRRHLSQQQHQHQQQHQLPQQQQQQHMPFGGPSLVADSMATGGPPTLGNNNTNSSLYMANPMQPATEQSFSVLSMGNGNYLKVFHHQDDKFQNYELFSNNSFIPMPQMGGGGQMGAPTGMHANQPPVNLGGIHQHPLQQPPPMHLANQIFYPDVGPALSPSANNLSDLLHHNAAAGVPDDNAKNRLINKFADNWVPNMSGTYSPFGEPATIAPQHQMPQPHHLMPMPRDLCTTSGGEPFGFVQQPTLSCSPVAMLPSSMVDGAGCPANRNHHSPVQQMVPAQPNDVVQPQLTIAPSDAAPLMQSTGGGGTTNGSFQHHPAEPFAAQKMSATPKKPRMVAEVKPMRMTYSDVLSKNVLDGKETANSSGGGSPVGSGSSSSSSSNAADGSSGGGGGGGKTSGSKASNKENKGKLHSTQSQNFDHKRATFADNTDPSRSTNSHPKNGHLNYAGKDAGKAHARSTGNGSASNDDRNKSPDNENRFSASGRKKCPIQSSIKATFSKPKSTATPGDSSSSRKKPASPSDQELDEELPTGTQKPTTSTCFLYNVCKNDSSKPSSASTKKSGRQSTAGNSASSTGGGGRSSVSKSERFTAYLHRRQQRSSRQKGGYDLVLKVLEKWLELLLRFAVWLFDLVTDVVILSGGMLWDFSQLAFENSKHFYELARKELKQNSGRPTAICKAWLVRFDKRFGVDSRWAFWRRFVKKQVQPLEQVRCGRLPTTGDEAMYSLLNCKGKDAYSILGVPADCSQEQVRKHYKKIAVLVHPDKNKQAGAEEAFKILQRAFELIGEPENRAAYDQSLDEALNAEKACSELNELLTQLQSKIAEAANTIRCSSCGLRHPRRATGRPHFAARECSSCKIRHTAREGDIWAETTFFGLRWKYLALMEGKVFDITEWANCQKGALSHLQPNSHIVQYRIVLGNQQPNQQQQQQQQHANQGDRERGGKHATSEPSLDEFLDNLYSGQNPLGQNQTSGRRRGGRKN